MSDGSPATWWPSHTLQPAIDPQLAPATQYELLDALGRQAVPGRRGRRAQELAATLRDSYVQPNSDLDDKARRVYWRMMDAIDAARAAADSDAVDGIEARFFLTAQRWDVAHELAAQTRLRKANAASGITRDRALAKAVAATNRRVDAIVAYVRQLTHLAQAADRRVHGAALDGQRIDAIAATEADMLAVSHLGEMTSRARNLAQAVGAPGAPGASVSRAQQAFHRLTVNFARLARPKPPGETEDA
jgi:hypothetical protein